MAVWNGSKEIGLYNGEDDGAAAAVLLLLLKDYQR
jgi:hypothetical protein